MRRILAGNTIADHSDVDGASAVFILDWTPGFNGLSKRNCKTRRETFQILDLMRLTL